MAIATRSTWWSCRFLRLFSEWRSPQVQGAERAMTETRVEAGGEDGSCGD
jgi:hypothetical protein